MVAQSAGPTGESSVDPMKTAAPAWAALSGALWAPSSVPFPGEARIAQHDAAGGTEAAARELRPRPRRPVAVPVINVALRQLARDVGDRGVVCERPVRSLVRPRAEDLVRNGEAGPVRILDQDGVSLADQTLQGGKIRRRGRQGCVVIVVPAAGQVAQVTELRRQRHPRRAGAVPARAEDGQRVPAEADRGGIKLLVDGIDVVCWRRRMAQVICAPDDPHGKVFPAPLRAADHHGLGAVEAALAAHNLQTVADPGRLVHVEPQQTSHPQIGQPVTSQRVSIPVVAAADPSLRVLRKVCCGQVLAWNDGSQQQVAAGQPLWP